MYVATHMALTEMHEFIWYQILIKLKKMRNLSVLLFIYLQAFLFLTLQNYDKFRGFSWFICEFSNTIKIYFYNLERQII